MAHDSHDTLITFRDVQKTYDGETLIVKRLDLDIRRGEFLTLLGPSGSGKTTCLMMLAGFETPTSGEIRMGGNVINRVPPHRRNIGMVFQNYALFPHLTVKENLRFPLTMRRLPAPEIDARVARALAMVRMDGFANRYPQQMSGGQQQRIALARALVFEPQLVLMDEPLGALDKQLREQMQIEIKHIHASLGTTFVFVTHDQSEALTMSDRIAVFNDGAIQQVDAPAALYEEPANAFVASFIGENNTLTGVIEEHDGRSCTVRLESGIRLSARSGSVDGIGRRTVLSIRPERVLVNQKAHDCENRLSASLGELIYLGDHVRARLNVAGNSSFVAKVPISDMDASLRVGDPLLVGVPPEHLRALEPMALQ
jgi:putative spermidine/putrescine transport system ATP-binding protein